MFFIQSKVPTSCIVFKSYDQELARLLGLEMFREHESSGYEVTNILAQG
jgi:hypothetical protein